MRSCGLPKLIRSVEIWRQEGTGAFNSWNDVLELGQRKDGSFRLRLMRVGIEDRYTAILYRSKPFRSGKRLVQTLRTLHDAPALFGSEGLDEPLSLSVIIAALAEVCSFNPLLAQDAFRAVATELERKV